MTAPDAAAVCDLCDRPASVTVEPSRRTVARGADPVDPSLSVIAVLPDAVLCAAHADEVGRGEVSLGWCDDDRCRLYGEAGLVSPCGAPFTKLKR